MSLFCPTVQQAKREREDQPPPLPVKRRSTPSWSGGSDPESPTEKLLSVRQEPTAGRGGAKPGDGDPGSRYGVKSSALGYGPKPYGVEARKDVSGFGAGARVDSGGYGLRQPAGPRMGVSAGYYGAGSRGATSPTSSVSPALSPSRPAATPSPTLSQIVLRNRGPSKPGDDVSPGSTPTTPSSDASGGSAAASATKLQKPKVPPKPKPGAARMKLQLDQVSENEADSDAATDATDPTSTHLTQALHNPHPSSPDCLPVTSAEYAVARELLSDDEYSTDVEEWSLTSGLATVDSDDCD